jgi:ribose transport system ATP-binding protein
LKRREFSADAIKKMMVGRDVAGGYYRSDTAASTDETVILSVNSVFTAALENVTLAIRKGEILGIGGLTDSGMHELGKVVFGAVRPLAGNVRALSGGAIDNPKTAMAERIAYISKDRDQESLMTAASIKDNINLPAYVQLKTGPLISPRKERIFAEKWADELSIKMQGIEQYVSELSGGNKQKVALAKWLGTGADVFILDCPTRGIDIGVKENIYSLMMELRGMGKSILLISEELTEVIGMSDRVITLKNGSVSGEFLRDEQLTEGRLIEHII